TSEISSNVRPFKAAKKTFLRGKKFETKVIARLPFYRLIKSVLLKLHTEQLRHGDSNAVSKITLTAINILQDLTEYFILYYMEDSLRAAYHSKRVTVMDKDFKLVKMLRESALSAQMAG
ncbi:MAG: centromeric DNA-binding histone H3-like protein cse4, partial [Paramarteilia canceri]